jgi:signal recognition particle subunit SRP54
MFDELHGRLEQVFRSLRGRGKLSEDNIRASMREVRRALLEADVHYDVARDFVRAVESRAVGREVLRSITPGQQVVKIVHDELTVLLGATAAELVRAPERPTTVMLVGLQGSGKTTLAGKLALAGKRRGEQVRLVAADVQRPAAIDQLEVLGKQIDVEVFARRASTPDATPDVIAITREALADGERFDTVILDTAGRLTIDDAMMDELRRVRECARPTEVLLVVDAMTGQDAVRTASAFDEALGVDGIVLTKLDGDARGGAALSMRAVTGKPIKLASVGERLEALETFHPERTASRILGMGDVVSLVERAEEVMDAEEAARLERKIKKQEFDLEDFLKQIEQLQKMGPLGDLMKMIPGMNKLKGLQVDDRALVPVRAMIQSMTPAERARPRLIDGSRRRRIARGSGTSVQQVNRLLQQFGQVQKLMKEMQAGRLRLPF